MVRFRIRTNWTNSVSQTHEFELDDLADAATRDRLKWAFSDPVRLRPGETRQSLTERAAASFASVESPPAVVRLAVRPVLRFGAVAYLFAVSVAVLVMSGPIALVVLADRHREELRRLREQLCPHCRQKVDKLGGAAAGSGAAQAATGDDERRAGLRPLEPPPAT